MREDYVRPPLLGLEPPSRRAARWRFRAAMVVLVVLLAALTYLGFRVVTGGGDNPGLGAVATLSPPR